MATPLTVDLFALRESLIRGDLRDDFEESARRKVEVAEVPLEQADRHELEQMMYRTWYETALILDPADSEERIQHALQARYISLRARWQRYWTMHQARGGEDGCHRSEQLFYDLVSDLKSTYLVSIAKALGNDSAMRLWRHCDQLTQQMVQGFKQEDGDLAGMLKQMSERMQRCQEQSGERCTVWSPLVLDTYDQLGRLNSVLDTLGKFLGEHASAGGMATALFALDNEALLRGAHEAMTWLGTANESPAQTLIHGFREALNVIVTGHTELNSLFEGAWRMAA
jgi:hypothetical protein